jgi:uncharacterized membrane protein YqjE
MNNNVYNIGDRQPVAERPLGQTLHEVAHELRNFVNTRLAMLQSEMRENIANIKVAAPALIIGGLFVATAWLLFTGALVAVLTVAFEGSPYAAFLALVIVGALYAVMGACALWIAFGRIRAKSILPERTIEVLREDKVWLEDEARKHL